MQGTVLSLLLVATVLLQSALSAHDLSSEYRFSHNLHPDYTLHWTFDNTAQSIRFAVHVRTTGWIGFGLSPNGQMPQSDVVIGWVDGTGNHFDDRFADRRSLPSVDEQQNWFLVNAEEENGYTTLEFTRNYTSCDTRDRNIKHETARVVWSWNDNDPVGNEFRVHQSMGATSLNLLGGQVNSPQDPPDAQTLSITVNNVAIPTDETTYWCSAYRLPAQFDTQEVYVTKFAPIISRDSADYVHHLLVYLCDSLDGVDLNEQGHCNSINRTIRSCLGEKLVGSWAVGGEVFVYPSNIAFPIGGPGFPRYAVMQIHYNNPNGVSGIHDSSGLAFTYTATRREHNAGIIQLGHIVSNSQIIPPNAQNYSTFGVCHSDCTQQHFPAGGINIFGNFLHTHTIGSGLELSLLQQNNSLGENCFEEVQIVERNLNYDFNYQQTNHLPREIVVRPGDTILLRCDYKSSGRRTNITVGGESTEQEMCLSFIFYYPRVDLDICTSTPLLNNLRSFTDSLPLNLQDRFRSLLQTSISPNGLVNPVPIIEFLEQLQWNQEQIQAFETSIYTTGNQADLCFNANRTSNFIKVASVPKICQQFTEPSICSQDRGIPDSALSLLSHTIVIICFTLIALLVTIM